MVKREETGPRRRPPHRRSRSEHVVSRGWLLALEQRKGKEPSSLPSPAVFLRIACPDALVWARPHLGEQVRAPAPIRANFMERSAPG
jgi:hypothetical protein